MTALITADEVAAKLSVPKTWVLAEARASRIPHVRVGRYVRFRAEAVEEWVQGLETKPSPGQRPGGFPQ